MRSINEGQRLPGWPVLLEESFAATPALAMSGDGQLEISLPCWNSGLLHLLRRDGFEAAAGRSGRSINFPSDPAPSSAILTATAGRTSCCPRRVTCQIGEQQGDLSRREVSRPGTPDGQPISLSGARPVAVGDGIAQRRLDESATVALADIDHNGKLDVIAAASMTELICLSAKNRPGSTGAVSMFGNWTRLMSRSGCPGLPSSGTRSTRDICRRRTSDQPPVVGDIPNQIIPPGAAFFPISPGPIRGRPGQHA